MRRAVFVPCPTGDLPFTHRVFDAILHGAIPVMFSRPFSEEGFRGEEGPAWWYRKAEVDNMRKQNMSAPIARLVMPDIGIPLDDYLQQVPTPVVRESVDSKPSRMPLGL